MCGSSGKIVEQFYDNQMDLPQIGLSGIDGDARAVADRLTGKSVALDPMTRHEAKPIHELLGKAMLRTSRQGDDLRRALNR